MNNVKYHSPTKTKTISITVSNDEYQRLLKTQAELGYRNPEYADKLSSTFKKDIIRSACMTVPMTHYKRDRRLFHQDLVSCRNLIHSINRMNIPQECRCNLNQVSAILTEVDKKCR